MISAARAAGWQKLRELPIAFWVEGFALVNLAFLGLDIWIAHQANAFERRVEWLPVVFSVVAPLLLAPLVLREQQGIRRGAFGLVVGGAAIVVGLLGMLFHLESGFFEEQTLHGLVYAAPFVAPLSYVGIGLLLVLNRLEPTETLEWARWVLFLAAAGFVGNVGLSLLDHAQNGFYRPIEWLSVVGSAFGTSFLVCLVARPEVRALRRVCAWVMGAEALLGLLGFALHLYADLVSRPAPGGLKDRLVYGAPAFAPLLFTNLAGLAALGLWSLERALGDERSG
jgi:hypothetical protein